MIRNIFLAIALAACGSTHTFAATYQVDFGSSSGFSGSGTVVYDGSSFTSVNIVTINPGLSFGIPEQSYSSETVLYADHNSPMTVGDVILAVDFSGTQADLAAGTAGFYAAGVYDCTQVSSGKCTSFVGTDTYTQIGTVSSVPLPAAAWLFGSALLGLAAVKRRKE